MYAHFRSVEASTSVRPTYMKSQPHINEKMRSILVDWLVEVRGWGIGEIGGRAEGRSGALYFDYRDF